MAAKSDRRSRLVEASLHAIEEVNEVARVAGLRSEYRQLGKGAVTSRWRSLHIGRSTLASHRVDNHLHARVAPPEGCVALAVMPSPSRMSVDGEDFASDQILLWSSEADLVTPPGKTRCDALWVPAAEFEASGRALFPRFADYEELVRLVPCPAPAWSKLQAEMGHLLRRGDVDLEELSVLLDRFLDVLAGMDVGRERTVGLGNGAASRVARLAQDYIEGRYAQPIRMADLCRHTGVSLRTLQRSFSEYFQVSPSQFVKARRLDAVRLALTAGDPSESTVASAALEAGFTHLGRFSVDYRKHFGESPRVTLARRVRSSRRSTP